MDFDEMGIGEILELAEDLGWTGCFDLLCIEGIDPDELERQAIQYIKTAQSLKDMVITTNKQATTEKAAPND